MNEQNFIQKMSDKAYYSGRAWAYDDALFLLELYGDDLERVKAELQVRMKESDERRKQCLL